MGKEGREEVSKPKLLILEGKNGPRVTAFCDGPAVNEAFDVTRSGDLAGEPDLVYCQTYGQRNSFEQLKRWGGPYVLHVGGDIWDERRERKGGETLGDVMQVMWGAAKVVCVSEFLARTIRHNMDQGAGRAGHVVALPGGLWGTDHTEHGIDPSRFEPKEDYSIVGRPLVVMNINLTVRRKWRGMPIFMEAAHGVLKEHDARVVCVGKVKGKRVVAADWYHRWGLQMIPPSDLWPELLRRADLYVHPSMFDGFPRSVAEVCCVGLPAVLFQVAGTPEVSDEAVLVKPSAGKYMATVLNELLSSEEARQTIGTGMRSEALEKTEKHRGDYAQLLLDALEG